MYIKEKVYELISKVAKLSKSDELKKGNALPSNCYFLNEDEIVCYERRFGDSRYPYAYDGLTLWAYSSGNIKIEESAFNVTLDFSEGKNPNVCFYVGKKKMEGYFPVSITGAGKLPFEEGIERYTVFTPDAAYYITQTIDFCSCVRMFVDNEKNVRFTLWVENTSDKPLNAYLSTYLNCMLSHGNYEFIETKWFRSCQAIENGFALAVTECLNRDTCLEHKAKILRDYNGAVYSTTAHTDYCGGMHNQLCCSTALQQGKFDTCKKYTEFTDTAIAGDIIPLMLSPKESFAVSYTLTMADKVSYLETEKIDEHLYAPKAKGAVGMDIPKVAFEGEFKDLLAEKLNFFIKYVFRHTEFCARAKN